MSESPIIKPVPLGAGGPLWAVLCAAIGRHKQLPFVFFCPLIAILWLPLSLLLPSLYVSLGLKALGLNAGKAYRLSLSAAWLLGLYILYQLLSMAVSQVSLKYFAAAAVNSVLQLATPEQLDYADSMNLIIMIGAFVFMLMLNLCMFLGLSSALTHKLNAGLKAFCCNLPGLLLLAALFAAVIAAVERYFAHLKLEAIQAVVLHQEYFDPGLPFIALRLYIAAVFLGASFLMAAMGLNLLPPGFSGKKP